MKKSKLLDNELEIRGRFTNRQELLNFLSEINNLGTFQSHRFRLSVIFTDKNKSGIDLQIRLHNLTTEIVLKIGQHTSLYRKEYKIRLSHEEFLNAVNLFNNLGFTKGIVADCEDWIFIIDNAEIKITSCDNKIYCWEIESLHKTTKISALTKIAKMLNLKTLDNNELKQYWIWMKKYANKVFDNNKLPEYYHKYLKKINDRKKHK